MPRSAAPVHRQRREAVLARLHRGAHRAQRLGDAVDRPAPDRLVAVERPDAAGLAGEPAGQQPQQRAGVADVEPAAGGLQRARAGRRRGSTTLPSPCSSTPAPSVEQGVERRARVGGVEVVADRAPARRTSRRTAPRGARSTCRRAARSRPAAAPRARSGRSRVGAPGSRGPRSAPRAGGLRRRPAIQSVMAPERMSGAGASAMSTMFTPALPSASATWATIPGRLGTVSRSS